MFVTLSHIRFNVLQTVSYWQSDDGSFTLVKTAEGTLTTVTETPEEIDKIMDEAMDR